MDWLPRECSGSGYQRLPLPTWGPVCTPGSLSNECMSVTSHWCHVGSRPCWAPACLATTAARYCDSGSAMPPLFTALRARAKARPRVYTASASSAPCPSPSHPVLPLTVCGPTWQPARAASLPMCGSPGQEGEGFFPVGSQMSPGTSQVLRQSSRSRYE